MPMIDIQLNATLIEQITIFAHVLCGFTALVMAPVAMRTRKGGAHHRRWGRVYFWAMFGIFVSALGLLVFRPNIFLFIISILSFYAALTGYRSLFRKRAGGATALDWSASLLALAAGAAFIAWGALTLLGLLPGFLPGAFSLLGIGFGASLSWDALSDLRSYRTHPADPRWWWYYHIERMSGSYIAAVTAFAVQNLSRHMPLELAWLPWVLPAAIGMPLIARTIRAHRRRFAHQAAAHTHSPRAETSLASIPTAAPGNQQV